MLLGGAKCKLFSAGNGYIDQIFTRELSLLDLAEALKQVVLMYSMFSIITLVLLEKVLK